MDATYSQFSAELLFDDTLAADLTERMVLAGVGFRLSEEWSMHFAAGGIVDGEVDDRTGAIGVGPGAIAGVSASWRVLPARGARPFVDLTAALAGSWASTDTGHLVALDARGGASVGWVIAGIVSPYMAVRAFGGPVFWEDEGESRTGSDRYHYQVALGTSVDIARTVGLFVDWAPLGERAVSAGVSLAL